MLKKFLQLSLFLAFLGVLAISGAYFYLKDQLPSVESLQDVHWQAPMQIFSADGELISQFGEKKRIPLTLDEVPQQLIDALLATEDDRFYHHFGVDPIGMGRAILGRLIGVNKGGGSTITMQVARNFFLTREQTIIRKLREIFLTFHIESLLTKDEILELYINKIELGHRAFGFGAAAQVYYGKNLNELTLAQIAVLAGLPKAPSNLNPISSPSEAKKRRAVVLHRMLVSDYISPQEYRRALAAPITGKRHGVKITLNAPYIAEMAHQEMLLRYGKEKAYTNGYKVYLTVPAKLQLAAQKAVVTNTLDYDKRHGYRGPIANLAEDKLGSNNQSHDRPNLAANSSLPQQVLPSLQLSNQQLIDYLTTINQYQHLLPAVVTDVFEQSAIITLPSGQQEQLPWSGLSWARAYISDDKQGAKPETASEILSLGDVIYVEHKDNGYQLSQLPQVSSALVSISPDDGAIKAAVGGFSFEQSQFNRVTQAKRQAGSNIKPFIYSAALEEGYTLASIINDAPINHWDQSSGVVWRPKNSPPIYQGPIRLRLALAQSKNVIAVRLLRKVGLTKTINYLTKFGFNAEDLPAGESLALGSASLTPLEMVTGFATFANGGFLISPYLISHIENSDGVQIFKANPAIACSECENATATEPTGEQASIQQASTLTNDDNFSLLADLSETNLTTEAPPAKVKRAPRVINAQNAFLITDALNSAIWGADWHHQPFWQGTGFRARALKRRDIAGKTGTTNQAKDAWFSGFSRRLVTTSWIGFDDHERNLGRTHLGSEAGARSAQPSWILFMQEALKDFPYEPFEQPDNIISVRIDKTTGKLTNKTDRSSRFEYFKLGTSPEEAVEQAPQNIISGKATANPVDSIF